MENIPPAPTNDPTLLTNDVKPVAAITPTAAVGPLRYTQQLCTPAGCSITPL